MNISTHAWRNYLATLAVTLLAVALGAAVVSCGADGGAEGGFISANPSWSPAVNKPTGSSGSGAGGASTGTPSTTSTATTTSSGAGGQATVPSDDAEKAIAEADIIQLHDDRLYALSEYSGLSIIDVSVQDELVLLGRHPTMGKPFEMYLRDGVVIALFSRVLRYESKSEIGGWLSAFEALDVSDPSKIVPMGSFDLPGEISDSRIVGDVLYAVSFEKGHCYQCGSEARTTITSVGVADVANMALVDWLSFKNEAPSSSGLRLSVSVTPERMYVAGVDWSGDNESTIEVVDISDPSGKMVKGASVKAAGQITSRWQMDEHEGVLRVISQPRAWAPDDFPGPPDDSPWVQTFGVESSSQLVPLAAVELQIPPLERLRAVRFDGDRGYAITLLEQGQVQVDPLFIIDLSDPAAPQQRGELEIPGWVYHLEPRGDRLLGLGFDDSDPEGALNVSLFDVSDMDKPMLLKRVAFGGQMPEVAEDQNRIHKAFAVLDELNLVLVPFSVANIDQQGCQGFKSGIQLVDFANDTLGLRGLAPMAGRARRAFVDDTRLFAVSEADVASFDIDDRDAPQQTAHLPLAADVGSSLVVGDLLVRLGKDWWSLAGRLEVTKISAAESNQPLGVLVLSEAPKGADCDEWSASDAKMFANGQTVYLLRPGFDSNTTQLLVVDVADASEPHLVSSLIVDAPPYLSASPGMLWSGEHVVQHGSTLVFVVSREGYGHSYGDEQPTLDAASLVVVDISNPKQPRTASRIELPAAAEQTGLIVDGPIVASSHWLPLSSDPRMARFYLDRVDVSDPDEPSHTSVNVPGALLAYSAANERAITLDYKRTQIDNVTYHKCQDTYGGGARFALSDPDGYTGTCFVLAQTLKLLQLANTDASVLDVKALESGAWLRSPKVGDDRIFARVKVAGSPSGQHILAGSGLETGILQVGYAQAKYPGYEAVVQGTQLVSAGYARHLVVLDATELDGLELEPTNPLPWFPLHVSLSGDVAYCSLGAWGLRTLKLPN